MNRQSGMTIIELMVTLAVAAILIAAASPSFRDLIQNNRATAYANELVLAMTLARAEALKRTNPVTVCAASAPDPDTGIPGCSGTGDWEDGWIVFEDANLVGAPNPTGTGAELIRVFPAVRGFEASGGTLPSAFRFTRQGGASVYPTTAVRAFNVQAENCRGQQARAIDISLMGRVSVTKVECT